MRTGNMGKGICAAVVLAIGALGVKPASATELYTTQSDFSGWNNSGNMTTGVSPTDLDGSSVNGQGNTSNVGGAGTPGSLAVTWNNGAFNYFYGPGEQGNPAFLATLGNSGTILFDYTTPPAGTGNYFQLGLVLNYEGAFDQFFGGASVNLGGGVSEQAINYTLSSPKASYAYFQQGFIYNSNFNTNTPFTIDNIRTAAVPEPASLGMIAVVGAAALRRRRRTA